MKAIILVCALNFTMVINVAAQIKNEYLNESNNKSLLHKSKANHRFRLSVTSGISTNTAGNYYEEKLGSFVKGVSLFYVRRNVEFGINILSFPLVNPFFYYPTSNGKQEQLYKTKEYIAKTAVPITVVLNYGSHLSSTYAYIGLNTGLVICNGEGRKVYSTSNLPSGITLYSGSGTGYTLGGQVGLHYDEQNHLGIGLQAQMNYMSAKLNTNHDFDWQSKQYGIFYLNVQAIFSYKFY